jgi:5-oxoprolinase (ATP-hydrolysing) subunit C
MAKDAFKFLDAGLGATLQARPRTGWRRFGVPPSGAMDEHAAAWANQLLDNPPDAPVIEMLLQGARLEVLTRTWAAITGADANSNLPPWRAVQLRPGHSMEFPRNQSGVWIYLAVPGGFQGERILGSRSVYARGRLGRPFSTGDMARQITGQEFSLPSAVSGRTVHWSERRDYEDPPPLRAWPGPQWELFSAEDRERFFEQEWTVNPRSDRVGYRLDGEPLCPGCAQIISEPVLVGSVQVPSNGLPIVTMRDGPTAGGYPKIALLDPPAVSWLAQCRPGTRVHFEPVL